MKSKRYKKAFASIEYIILGIILLVAAVSLTQISIDRNKNNLEVGANNFGDKTAHILSNGSTDSYLVSTLNVSPDQIDLLIGEQKEVQAILTPSNLWSAPITWSSSLGDSEIFEIVGENNQVSSVKIKGKKEGKALLNIKTTDGSNISKDVVIRVGVNAEGISVDGDNEIFVTETSVVEVNLNNSLANWNNKDIEWKIIDGAEYVQPLENTNTRSIIIIPTHGDVVVKLQCKVYDRIFDTTYEDEFELKILNNYSVLDSGENVNNALRQFEKKNIIFKTNLEDIPLNAIDVSQKKNKSTCIWEEEDSIIIGSKCKNIYLNPDSSKMFKDLEKVINVAFDSGVITDNLVDISYMFANSGIINISFPNYFNTESVSNVEGMFNGCINLDKVDLSNLDFTNVTNMSYMFNNSYKITEIKTPINIPNNVNMSNITSINLYDHDNNYKKYQQGEFLKGNTSSHTLRNISEKGILIFNANDGKLALNKKDVYIGDNYGELPIPTKDGYSFNGWYTDLDNGSKVDENTIMKNSREVIYAHWMISRN